MMSDFARAAVVTEFGKPLSIEQVKIPELEPSALLVKVDAATLCGTDIHCWHGEMPKDRLPYIPGHETAGTVVAIEGKRYDVLGGEVKIGDRIIWSYPFCGRCYYCTVAHQPSLCPSATRFGRARVDTPPYLLGGCATHHYVPPRSEIIKLPPEVTSELAASAACALRTVVHAFERLGTVWPNETVVIQGCGPVGLYATAVARDHGFYRILVIGAPEERLRIAKEFGADFTLNLGEVNDAGARRQWVLEKTQDRGADVVIQCAQAAAIPEGLSLVRDGGRYLSVGGGGVEKIEVPARALETKMLQIIGVRSAEGRHFYQAVQFLASRRVPFDKILSGRYSLNNVTEAFEAMAAFREIKPVIHPFQDV